MTHQQAERSGLITYQTVFVGEDADPDTLWFTTFNHQRLYRDSPESDQAEITIWAESGPRDLGPGDVLYHRRVAAHRRRARRGRTHLAARLPRRDLQPALPRQPDLRVGRRVGLSAGRVPQPAAPGGPDRDGCSTPPDPEGERGRDWIEKPYLTTVNLHYADPIQPLAGVANGPMQNLPSGELP